MSFLPPLEPTFEAALRDVEARGPEFRERAARRLASPPDGREEEARRGLRALIEDERAMVRAAALEGLGAIGVESDVEAALLSLEDPSDRVKEAGVVALSALAGDRRLELLAPLLSRDSAPVRFQAVRCLAQAGADAAPALLSALTDGDAEVRAEAALALGSLGDARHADRLAVLLDDAPEVALASALALADLDDPRAAERLAAEVDRRRGPERLELTLALAKLRAPTSRTVLTRAVESFFTPAHVRAAAAAGLAALGDAKGDEALRRILEKRFSPARGLAVECIGALGIVRFAPDLERLARRPRGVDEEAIREARTRLAATDPAPSSPPRARPP